jgi:hypothetical protein
LPVFYVATSLFAQQKTKYIGKVDIFKIDKYGSLEFATSTSLANHEWHRYHVWPSFYIVYMQLLQFVHVCISDSVNSYEYINLRLAVDVKSSNGSNDGSAVLLVTFLVPLARET